jgi:hypothetical protein
MQRGSSLPADPQSRARASTLFVRLLVVSLVPTLCTAALLLCMVLLLPSVTRTYWMAAVFISLAVATLQAVWAGHLAKLLSTSTSQEGGGGERVARAGPEDTGAEPRTDAVVTAIVHVLDRVGTGEPPGDAAECVGAFRPVGQSLRALVERFERREADVKQFLVDYATAVGRVAESSIASATEIEGSFIDVVAISTRLKELRQSVEAIRREIAGSALAAGVALDEVLPPEKARASVMLELLGTRLDGVLDSLSELAATLEADASARRRTALDGTRLRGAAEEARGRIEGRHAANADELVGRPGSF